MQLYVRRGRIIVRFVRAVPSPQTTDRILNALTLSEFESLSRHLEPVSLRSGELLCRPEQTVTHAYFPTRGTVSLVSSFEDGDTVEVGMVGNEGMFGVGVFLGSVTTPLSAQVQLPGNGLRMRADVLRSEFVRLIGADSHTRHGAVRGGLALTQ